MKSLLRTALVLALPLSAFYGCKMNTETSDAKALDNFAGSQAVHSCSGTYKIPATAAIEAGLGQMSIVREALTAVPTNLQDIFFTALKGKIVVTAEVAKYCEQNTISCWQGTSQGPVIYIKATPKDIRHATVRSFGYFVSEELLKGSEQMEPKAQVGKAFLSDVAHSNSKYDLSIFRRQLDGAVLARDLSDAERNKRLDQLPPPVHAVARDVFYDYALAEAFDSWFCSASTHASVTAGGDFSRTGIALQGVVTMLQSLNLDAITKEEKTEGLALFGRYHTGSIIRNIIARRQDGYGMFQGNGPIRRSLGFEAAPYWAGNGGGQSGGVYAGSQISSSQYGTTQQIAYTAPQTYANNTPQNQQVNANAASQATVGNTQQPTVGGARQIFTNREGYNSGEYRQQANGTFGWYPAGASTTSDFTPTYFQTRTDKGWEQSGSIASTPAQIAAGLSSSQPATTTVAPAQTAPAEAPPVEANGPLPALPEGLVMGGVQNEPSTQFAVNDSSFTGGAASTFALKSGDGIPE